MGRSLSIFLFNFVIDERQRVDPKIVQSRGEISLFMSTLMLIWFLHGKSLRTTFH